MLLKILSKTKNQKVPKRFNGAPCAYFDGVFNYFTINKDIYHSKKNSWNGPCVNKNLYRLRTSDTLLIWLDQCNLTEFCYPDFRPKTIKLYCTMETGMMSYPTMTLSKPLNNYICLNHTYSTT